MLVSFIAEDCSMLEAEMCAADSSVAMTMNKHVIDNYKCTCMSQLVPLG